MIVHCFRGFSFVPLSIPGLFDHEKKLSKSMCPCYLQIRTIASIPFTTWNFGTESIFGGVSFNNNSGYNSDLNTERRLFRKTELDNEEGLLNIRGNTLADIIEEVPDVDCFSKTTLASTCEKMKKASEEIRKTFAGINDTSNNIATVMAGLPKMAIINGNCQGRNIHVFCPETDDCYLKPSDILSLPSKMVTDTAFQFIPIKYPLVDESYESNQMYPGFPLEMLQPQLMFAELPELKKRSQIYFRDAKKQKLQGNNKVSLKNYDQQNTKKYDELTNSNLNIREPAEHIVDCWSDDGQNRKYVKHSFNKKCKVTPRNRKPSPWKLFGKSKPKAKVKCQKQSEKEEILRRTLSCTVDGNEENFSGNDEYIPIPIKLTKFFHSLPACGSQGTNKSNWIGVHMDDFEDSNSWDSKINPLEFNCAMNKKKIMKKKIHHPEHPNKPVAKPRKQKYIAKASGYEMDTNSESSSIAKSECSRPPLEKYYARESYHPKDEKAYRYYQPSNPSHYHKIKKPYHEQNRKGWQNVLKNCFKLKVHGSRAYLEPVQKENGKKIYDRESMTFLKVLPPSEEVTESYMKSESVASKIYQNHSSEEYLFKELVKIPDEFLKKSDHLSKQINVVENHVRNLEKLLTYQYHSELSGQLNFSKTDVPCTSLDNKASKTSNSGFNITHPVNQKLLNKIELSPSDPLDLKAFNSLQSGGLEFCKNISVQELQSLFDNYLEKLQKICMTTEHTKDICTLILDIISKPDFKKVKLSSYVDETIFKNDLLGLSNEVTLPPKNMQRNNHSRVSDTTFDSSDLNITYSIVDFTKTADKENSSSLLSKNIQSSYKSDIFRDYTLNKLSHNNNTPFHKIKYTKKGSAFSPKKRTSNSRQKNRHYILKSFKINDVEKRGKWVCRSCCNNNDINNSKCHSAKCLKHSNRQNLHRLVHSDSMLLKPRNESTSSFDSLSSCHDELYSSSNERSSSCSSDSGSECLDSSCSNGARSENNGPHNTNYFPKSHYCYVSCCKTVIPSERVFGSHSNASSVSRGSRIKRRSFFEISINNHNKKIEHPTKTSFNNGNHTQNKNHILNEQHSDEFGMSCENQNNVFTNKYEVENLAVSELTTKDTKSDISVPTGTSLWAAKNLPSKNLYLSLSDIQKLEEDEDDSKICDFFANDSKSSFKIKPDSSSSSASRRESFYSAMSCSSKKCPEVNSTIDSASSLENNDSASSMLNYETLTFYSKLISPPHKSSVFTNANFFRESELLPQRTLSTYENTKDNFKFRNPQKMLKRGNKLGSFDWIVEQRKDFNVKNGAPPFAADERNDTSAISLSKKIDAYKQRLDIDSILLKDRLCNFTEIQSMPENDSMFSVKEDMNNVDASAHCARDDQNITEPIADLHGSNMFSSAGMLERDEQISTTENNRKKDDSWSPTQFETITETVMLPLLNNYFGDVKNTCYSDDRNFTEAIVESVGFDITSSADVSESSRLSSNIEYIRKNDDIWNSEKKFKTVDKCEMLSEEKIDLDVNAQYAGDDINCFEPNFESLQTILVCGAFDSEQTIGFEEKSIKETPTKSDISCSPDFMMHNSVINIAGTCEQVTENVQHYEIHEREKFSNISSHEFINYFQTHLPRPEKDGIGGGDLEGQNKHELDNSNNTEFHLDAVISSSHVEENNKIIIDTDEPDIRRSKDDIAAVEKTVDFPAMIQLPVDELIFFQKMSKNVKDNVETYDRFCPSNENKRVINVDVGVQHSNDDIITKESINNEAVECDFETKLCNVTFQISSNDNSWYDQQSLFKSEGEETLILKSETHLSPCEFNVNLKVPDKTLLEEKDEMCLTETTLSTAVCLSNKTFMHEKDDFEKNESDERTVYNAMDNRLEAVSLHKSNVEADGVIPSSNGVSNEYQDKDGQLSLVRGFSHNSDEEKSYSLAPNKDTNPTDIGQCEITIKEESVDSKTDNLVSTNKFDFPGESTKVEESCIIESAQTEINMATVTESGKCDKEEITENEVLPRNDINMTKDNHCAIDICKPIAKLYKSKSLSLEIEKRQFEEKPRLESNKNHGADVLLDEAGKKVCTKVSSTSINSSWNTHYAENLCDPRSIPKTVCEQSEVGLLSLDNDFGYKEMEHDNLHESDRTCDMEINLDSKETSTEITGSLEENNFLSLVNVKKADQIENDFKKHRAILQRARTKKLFLGITRNERIHQSKKCLKDSIQQERNRELTLFNFNFDTGKLYEQDEMKSEILEIGRDQSSQIDKKITPGLKPVCQMKFNHALKTVDGTRSPIHPLTEFKNSQNRDTTKRPLSYKQVPNIVSDRIHSNFKGSHNSSKCKHDSDRTCDTSVSPRAPSKSGQEISDGEVECFDMTKLNLHSQKFIRKKFRREKLHSGYELCDSYPVDRVQALEEINMLTISDLHDDITPRKCDVAFKKFENNPKTRCDQAYRRWKDIQNETRLPVRESSSHSCWKVPEKSHILPTKQQKCGKFPQPPRDDERLSANASQSFDVGQHKSFGALRSQLIPRNLKSAASKRVEFAQSMFSNSKSNLKVLLSEVDKVTKENIDIENKQKIDDLEKEIALYKSRICEMKRHLHMKGKHSANGDQESRIKLYGNKNMHQHYEDLLKIFKRKEYGSKVRMNMLRHQSLLSSVRRSSVFHEKSKLQEKCAKGKRKMSRPRHSSCLAEFEAKPKAKSYISSDTFPDDSLYSAKVKSSGLLDGSFGPPYCETLMKQKDKYETVEVRTLKSSFGRWQRDDNKKKSRRQNEVRNVFGESVQRRNYPEKGNTCCKKIRVIFGLNKIPKFKRSSTTLSTLSSDFLARKLRKPIATRKDPLSEWVRTAFPYKKTCF